MRLRWHGLRGGGSGTLRQDIRVAFRRIIGSPLFSTVVIAVVALGIGINAGLLTTLHTYAWMPAPGIPPDARLARLTATVLHEGNRQEREVRLALQDVGTLRAEPRVFDEVAGWTGRSVAADFGGGTEAVVAYYISSNFFRTLRASLAAGSSFPEEADQAALTTAIIGHSLWMSHYDGSPAALGRTIRVMNTPFTIVGVAPPQFTGVDVEPGRAAIWLPLGARALAESGAAAGSTRRDARVLESVVRLAPGVDPENVRPLTAVIAAGLARQEPEAYQGLAFHAERLSGMSRRESSTREFIAAVAVVSVLIVIITCSNVSSLLLGRAVARRHEVGVRLSLGASRFRIVRQLLTESLLYALAGAVVGLALYAAGIKVAYATLSGVVPGLEPKPVTFLAAALFALLTTVVFGLIPALHASRADIGVVIRSSGTQAVRRARLQSLFVVIQLASSQPVLIVTSLVLADLRGGQQHLPGEGLATVVTLEAHLLGPQHRGGETRASQDSAAAAARAALDLIRRRLVQVPGVAEAAIRARGSDEWFDLPGTGEGGGGLAAEVRQVPVSADYFAVRGIPIIHGRAIGSSDDHRGSATLVLNAAAARRLWPNRNPVGHRLMRRSPDPAGQSRPLEVIGVAGSPSDEPGDETPLVFAPLADANRVSEPSILVRTAGDAHTFLPPIRAAITEVEPYAAIRGVRTLAEQFADRRRETIESNLAALAVGVGALVLASLGLYAIIALAVAQRTHEIGVRLAIGATPGGVVRHFLRHGLLVSMIGLAIGLPLTLAGIRLVQANVLNFTLQNVAAVLVVIPVLIVVALLASWLPARRAGRVDPLVALRSE